MSDNMQNNPIPTPTQNPGDQGNGNSGNGANTQQPAKENFLVRGFRKAKEAVSEGWKTIKSHPVTHGLMALGGTVGGGYIVYKVMDAQRPIVPEPPTVPAIPEPAKEEEQEQTNSVEYVDIPETTTAEE